MHGESLCSGNWLEIRRQGKYEFVSRLKGIGVVEIVATTFDETLPVTERTKVILIEQFRPAVNKRVIELPAGVAGDHNESEKLEEAVARELCEETGYLPRKVAFLSSGPSSAGLSDEVVSFFLAVDLISEGAGGGVDDENIIVHEVPIVHVNSWLSQKTQEDVMIDPRIWAGLWLRIAFLTGNPHLG